MSIHPNLGRRLAAIFVLLGLPFIGALNAGRVDAQPLNRQHPAKLAVALQAALHAHSAAHRRSRLRQVAERACASHRRALCVESRAQLARIDTRSAHIDTAAHRRAGRKSTPSSSDTFSSSNSGDSGSAATGSSSSSGSPAGSPSGSSSDGDPIASAPVFESPAPAVPFQPGLVGGPNMSLDVQGAMLLGAKLVRIEFPIETTPAQMETTIGGYAAKGIRVLVLATFRGTLPTPAQAQSLAAWAEAYGPGGTFWANHPGGQAAVQSIEFGNETSYGYQYGDSAGDASYRERAENYARRFKEAAEAIATTGIHVGLLAQADDWTGDWVNGMYAAVPDLSRYVAGWTIHPYHSWRSRLEDLLEQTRAHGAPATIPIDITEFGLPTDNGNCLEDDKELNRCMPYSEAASILRGTVSEIRQLLGGQLGMCILYQVRDQELSGKATDSEDYYGALQHELQPKGEYTTAVKEVLASS